MDKNLQGKKGTLKLMYQNLEEILEKKMLQIWKEEWRELEWSVLWIKMKFCRTFIEKNLIFLFNTLLINLIISNKIYYNQLKFEEMHPYDHSLLY